MEFDAKTDAGKCRAENQDCFGYVRLEHGFFAVVCDGMGGAAGGALAARLACDTMTGTVDMMMKDLSVNSANDIGRQEIRRILWTAVGTANKAVNDRAAADPALLGMGTTVVALLLYYGQAYTVHVGDSRAYLLRDGVFTRLTHDHSYVQSLVDAGTLTDEEARTHPRRNVITRAVGVTEDVTADYGALPLRAGDLFLLCTDGLTGMVDDAGIASAASAPTPLAARCDALQNAALDAGGDDNVTVFLISCDDKDVYTVWEALTEVQTADITAPYIPPEGTAMPAEKPGRLRREEIE